MLFASRSVSTVRSRTSTFTSGVQVTSGSRLTMAQPFVQGRSKSSSPGIAVGVYETPKETDLRSPCPALNTLANHGYLPRDGRKVSASAITKHVSQVYGLSIPLAALIAYGTVFLLRWKKPWTWLSYITLQDIAANHGVEHRASLAHANTPHDAEYGATCVCPILSQKLLEQARDGGYTTDDFAQIRVQRQCDPDSDIQGWRAEIARGECSLTMNVFAGDEQKLSEEVVKTWWIGERLPDGFKPARKTTLRRAADVATEIRNKMTELQKANANGVKQ